MKLQCASCRTNLQIYPCCKQEAPGRYDAAVWEALDRVLDLKVIISLL